MQVREPANASRRGKCGPPSRRDKSDNFSFTNDKRHRSRFLDPAFKRGHPRRCGRMFVQYHKYGIYWLQLSGLRCELCKMVRIGFIQNNGHNVPVATHDKRGPLLRYRRPACKNTTESWLWLRLRLWWHALRYDGTGSGRRRR